MNSATYVFSCPLLLLIGADCFQRPQQICSSPLQLPFFGCVFRLRLHRIGRIIQRIVTWAKVAAFGSFSPTEVRCGVSARLIGNANRLQPHAINVQRPHIKSNMCGVLSNR